MSPEERRAREAAAGILDAEAQALGEARAELVTVATAHEVARRDTDAKAKEKRDRAADAAALALLLLFRSKRPESRRIGLETAADELRRLHIREASVWQNLAARFGSIRSTVASAEAQLGEAARGYRRQFERTAERLSAVKAEGVVSRTVEALDYRVERIAHGEVWGEAMDEVGAIQRSVGVLDGSFWREWSAVLDRRTCSVCADMDGKRIPAWERFNPECPAHGFCRCMTFLVRE